MGTSEVITVNDIPLTVLELFKAKTQNCVENSQDFEGFLFIDF